MPEWVTPAALVLVAIITSGATYLLVRVQRNSHKASAAGTLTDSALRILEASEKRQDALEADFLELKAHMTKRVRDLENRIASLEAENKSLRLRIVELEHQRDELRYGIRRLHAQLQAQGMTPVWETPDNG